tara:strand:+ start:19 stop:552 length:534 start_codon:yes stop_codon:yes gene_type:complete
MTNDLLFLIWLRSFDELSILFEVLSTRYFSFSLLLVCGLFFIFHRKTRIFLFVIACIILGDQLGAFLKDFFQEPRPCYQFSEQLIDLGVIKNACGERLTGMPSNHALNFFLFSTLVFLITKRKLIGLSLFFISFAVGLSRVFLAKHLLSQVIIGASLGILLGVIFYNILRKFKWIQK